VNNKKNYIFVVVLKPSVMAIDMNIFIEQRDQKIAEYQQREIAYQQRETAYQQRETTYQQENAAYQQREAAYLRENAELRRLLGLKDKQVN
jgi:hypothetical protein